MGKVKLKFSLSESNRKRIKSLLSKAPYVLMVLGTLGFAMYLGGGGGLVHSVQTRWMHIQAKVRQIRGLEEQIYTLKLENLRLKQELDEKKFLSAHKVASDSNIQISKAIENQTGTPTGRTLASIQYQPPTHLLPSQLYAQGISYFKAKEYEKSVKIFTLLSESENMVSKLQKGEVLFLQALNWYELDHLHESNMVLDQLMALQGKEKPEYVLSKARLLKGIIAERSKDSKNVQRWLTELVDQHPFTEEAKWVNLPSH